MRLRRSLDLHWQATRWRKGSWFQAQKLGLTFWDEAWMGLLGGLLLDQPKFYDPSMTGGHYRDFRSAEEIDATRDGFNQMAAIDRLLADLVGSKTPPTAKGFLTFKNLLLTLWARSWLKLSASDPAGGTIAVSRAAFRDFYQWLWTEKAGRRIIDDARKEHFIDWLAEASGMPDVDLRERLGAVFEGLFKEIERELAPVLPGNLDPRYIQLFLLKA
ncbi:DUF6178 family protein [Desulfosarcina cetonica]|uniref:DUF6178 family protein n=1 Tax=Desulfosarcina cetonica TaxID=90730 RepID=UPI00155DCBCF|nr:DUF6178 family protein [Desulfosarcina cetonica]